MLMGLQIYLLLIAISIGYLDSYGTQTINLVEVFHASVSRSFEASLFVCPGMTEVRSRAATHVEDSTLSSSLRLFL